MWDKWYFHLGYYLSLLSVICGHLLAVQGNLRLLIEYSAVDSKTKNPC